MARDIVCDKLVNEEDAATDRLMLNHQGKTYYFCSRTCMEEFQRNPDQYGAQKPGFYTGPSAVENPPSHPPG
jgi:YHS domain-containing protein